MFFEVLLSILAILVTITLVVSHLRNALRSIFHTIAFNTGGGSPMARLVPNLAYLGLFLLLINATWF